MLFFSLEWLQFGQQKKYLQTQALTIVLTENIYVHQELWRKGRVVNLSSEDCLLMCPSVFEEDTELYIAPSGLVGTLHDNRVMCQWDL